MSPEEKKTTFDEEDPGVSRKEVSRSAGTKMMGIAAITVLLLMFLYVVHLHVRLDKIEQCQRVAETTRRCSFAANANVDVDDETDKVRNCRTWWLYSYD